MPTYDYQCQRCGHRFELLQGINDPPRKRCPVCRGKVKRLLSAGGGLIFKGSGFYITDYKRKEQAPSTPAPDAGGEKPAPKQAPAEPGQAAAGGKAGGGARSAPGRESGQPGSKKPSQKGASE